MNRLRKLRETAGLTLSELADFCGVHQQSIARFQNGTRKPRRSVRKLLATALGISEEEVEQALKEPADA